MATLPELTGPTGPWASVASDWSTVGNGNLETISGADDADYGEDTTNSTGTWNGIYDLDNMPSDFSYMISVSIQLRYGWGGSVPANLSWDNIYTVIYCYDGGLQALANGGVTVAGPITATSPTTMGSPHAMSVTGSGGTGYNNKTWWDSAGVLIANAVTRSKGGSSTGRRLYALSVTGTYQPTVTGSLIVPEPRRFRSRLLAARF